MPIINSKTGTVRKAYSIEELRKAAAKMRGLNLIALCAAGSGHSGGTLSIMDITAALYLRVLNHDPEDPFWPDRDRVIWSTGHKAPSLYLGLGMAGYFEVEDVVRLRKLYSPYQGHPHWLKLDGVEASTGSLGQGLSIAVGMALAAGLDNRDYQVYSINGDGELQEGQVWEAIMEAGHYGLNNLTCIVDTNRLQIDGWVDDVMKVEPLADKFKSFLWDVVEIDGHDMAQVVAALEKVKNERGDKPVAIIANTVKGKGVDFMEDIAGWHGKSPDYKQTKDGLSQLGLADEWDVDALLKRAADYQKEAEAILEAKMPVIAGGDFWWNHRPEMKVEMDPTRKGFGRALNMFGDDERIVCLGCDISGSITIADFNKGCPDRDCRFLSMGIAEQSATCVAAGLAKEGKLPVLGTYGVFASGRNLDQIRTTVCYGEFNVFIAGAHGGVSVGPDGATHQALEELFQLCGLPNMNVVVPCDSMETFKATKYMLFELVGPKYLRFAREATPLVTDEHTPFVFGKANVIRYRGANAQFAKAFETRLAHQYQDEKEDLSILACGPMVPEAMRAAWILKEEYGKETRIINIHTVKPLDRETIRRAALETHILITAEEHQVGGFGNRVAAVLACEPKLYNDSFLMGMIGVKDRFGESGAPWELIKEFEVSGEHIVEMALKLLKEQRDQ
ncbi:transketolase [bacterium]|nr:transketolase [candidate division CSSED10-310 bacterium]